MPNETRNQLYLSDRDIYDGLLSAKLQITPRMLKEFFLERGIFLSGRLSREELVKYISKLNLDYHDVQFLIEQLTPPSRKEKTRFFDLDCDFEKQDLVEIINKIESERSEERNETYQSRTTGFTNKVAVNIEYEEIDLSKTRLRQKRPKEALVEVEKNSDNKLRIRFPDNERAEEIVGSLKQKIIEEKKIDDNGISVDLSEIQCAESRTSFFIKIIENMNKELNLDNVSKVSVDSRLENENELPDEEIEEFDEEKIKGFVSNAILHGTSVLTSVTYQELTKRGFYIYKIAWNMIEKTTDGSKFVFESSFSDSPACKKFSCIVAGKYTRTPKGFTVGRKKLEPEDTSRYYQLLEGAAFNAFESIRAEYIKKNSEEIQKDE